MPILETRPSMTVLAAVQRAIDAGELRAPCGVVDVAAFDFNAAQMPERTSGLPIRVASKSLRSVAALKRALSHPGYQGVLAYSVPEALHLTSQGVEDIVVAYPCVDSVALRELAASELACQNITVMVDCVEHLELIEKAMHSVHGENGESGENGENTASPAIRVAIDLDCTLHLKRRPLDLVIGPRRSPLRFPQDVEAFAKDILARPSLNLVGIMAYEGQVASVSDGEKGPTGAIKRWLRDSTMRELANRRAECINVVKNLTDLEFINGGGTGSLNESGAEGTLTELAAGSGFYTPAIFDSFTEINHKAAAFFACQVSRKPAAGWATVNSGGWIASGPPAADRVPVPVWPTGLDYSSTEGAGEVQTPLHGSAADSLRVGDLVYFRHAKAGEMTEHVDHIAAVHADGTIERWDTYRGQGWTLR